MLARLLAHLVDFYSAYFLLKQYAANDRMPNSVFKEIVIVTVNRVAPLLLTQLSPVK